MKALSFNAIISSIRAKVDGSIGASFVTPELTSEQKAMFFDLQNKNVTMLITPLDEPSEEYQIDKDVDQKTPSQRQRHIIYAIWKNQRSDEAFSIFYEKMMDRIANGLKTKYLDE